MYWCQPGYIKGSLLCSRLRVSSFFFSCDWREKALLLFIYKKHFFCLSCFPTCENTHKHPFNSLQFENQTCLRCAANQWNSYLPLMSCYCWVAMHCKQKWKSVLPYNTTHKNIKADMICTTMGYLQLFKQVWRLGETTEMQMPCKPQAALEMGGENHKSREHGLLWKMVSSRVKHIWLLLSWIKRGKTLVTYGLLLQHRLYSTKTGLHTCH